MSQQSACGGVGAGSVALVAGLGCGLGWAGPGVGRAEAQVEMGRRGDQPRFAARELSVSGGLSGGVYRADWGPRTVAWRVDGTRVAVEADAEASGAARAALGAAVIADEPAALAGWRVWRMARPLNDAPLRSLLIRLADRGIFAAPVFFDDYGGAMWPTRQILARERPDGDGATAVRAALLAVTRSSERGELARPIGGPAIDSSIEMDWQAVAGLMRVETARADGLTVLEVVRTLAQDGAMEFAEPDMVFTGRGGGVPADPGFVDLWGLHNVGQAGGLVGFDMDAPEAWDLTGGEAGMMTVVLDVGVDLGHPDLGLAPGQDFTGASPSDGGPKNSFDNHGTAVAGCISAPANGIGTVGMAPGTRVASARTFVATNASGSWTSQASWTVNALAWARSIGARVTNNSNGYGFTSLAIEAMYLDTRRDGIVHFACAMNNGVGTVAYPERAAGVNAVASVDRTGARSSFSNWGVGLDFAAPGRAIYTTDRLGTAGWNSGNWTLADGTSFATPYVAGVAALVLSRRPDLEAGTVERVLQAASRDLGTPGYETNFGWGMPRALAALQIAGCAPRFVQQPEGGVRRVGQAVQVQAVIEQPTGAVYRWRKDGVPVQNGPTASGSVIGGAETDRLIVLNAQAADTGGYAVEADTGCVMAESATADVWVFPSCTGELDGDAFIDQRDFELFAEQYNVMLCADPLMPDFCSADFNGDGYVDDTDFVVLALAFGGECP